MIRFIKLRCRSCTSTTCVRKPMGSWSHDKEGCNKEVSGIDGNKYFHMVVEEKPRLLKLGRAADWTEYDEFIEYIHDLPMGERWKEFCL